MLNQNICNICGANYEYRNGRWLCPACGAYKAEELSNEEVTLLYNAAQKLRLSDFDEAEQEYSDIIEKYPHNPDGYWGRLLSKYGIKYEEDFDGRKIPTCYATSIESIISDKDYLRAIELADEETKSYFQKQAEYMERVRKEWVEKARREKPYDIFICYKDSDLANGIERTQDSIAAQDIYIHLIEQGYRVFFSRESLRDKVGEKYEPYIFNALSTSKVMIVYGTRSEYITSTWLKNEWHRFYKRVVSGEKHQDALLVACDGFSPNELPSILSSRQCFDARRRTFFHDLDKAISKIIKESFGGLEPRKPSSIVSSSIIHEHNYKSRVIAPTCLSKGYTIHRCDCGYEYRDHFTELVEHSFKIVSGTEPTCTEDGYAERKCEICGETVSGKIDALGHDFGEWVELKHPSCKEPGAKQHKCRRCGYSQSEILPAIGHQYGEWKTNPDGTQTRFCKNCGDTVTRIYDPNTRKHNEMPPELVKKRKRKKALTATAIILVVVAILAVGIRFFPQYLPDFITQYLGIGQNDSVGNDNSPVSTFTISFDSNGGSGSMDSISFKQNDTISLPFNSFVRAGYKFCGWSTTKNGQVEYTDRASVKFSSQQNIVLYAVWKSEELSYSLGLEYSLNSDRKSYSVTGIGTCTDTHLVIPNTYNGLPVTNIGKQAFYYCPELFTSVTIGDSVVSIGESAFWGSYSLISVTLGESVESIGEHAFSACYKLIEVCNKSSLNITKGSSKYGDIGYYAKKIITNASQSALKEKGEYIFYDDGASIYLVRYMGDDAEITLPSYDNNKKYQIYDWVFHKNKKITRITVPNCVVRIGGYAFYDCTSLKTINIPSSVTSMGDYVFRGCTSLQNITIPNSMTTISDRAFAGCSSLVSINVPQSVSRIKDYSLSHCTSLTNIRFGGTIAQWNSIAKETYWNNSTGNYIIYCTDGQIAKDGTITNNSSSTGSVGLEYKLNDDGNSYSVTGIGTCADTEIVIPNIYQGMPVTGIDKSAFWGCENLQNIVLSDKIESIGDDAFRSCSNLKNITIPKNVTHISSSAFVYCNKLSSINVDANNSTYMSLDGNLYSKNGKKFLYYAPGKSDTSFTISSNVECIGDSAFRGCDNLKTVTIPNSVTSIGKMAFAYSENITQIVVPDSVKDLGEAVFSCCSNLSNIVIGNNVETLGDSFASHCYGLTNITIPSSVKNISDSAFHYSKNLKTITVNSNNANYKSVNGVLYTKDGKTLMHYPMGKSGTSFTIPDGVEAIGGWAFRSCSKLTSINIPSSVINIGEYAFEGCGIRTITIPENVKFIGQSAFHSCSNLSSVTFESQSGWSVTKRDNDTEKLDISSSDLSNSSMAAQHLTTTYYFYNWDRSNTSYSNGLEYSTNDDGTYTVTGIGTCADTDIVIPSTYNGKPVTSTGEYAFSRCYNLTSIVIPNSVKSIGDGTFEGCNSLTSVDIPGSVTRIGDEAFEGCTNLTSIEIPNSVTSIGNWAFNGCNSLINVLFENNSMLTQIGSYAFYNCTVLTDIQLPKLVKQIGNCAFFRCLSLSVISIPIGVESIGSDMLNSCSTLESINYEGTIDQWNTITKGNSWNYASGNYIIYCTNGKIAKNGTIIPNASEYKDVDLSKFLDNEIIVDYVNYVKKTDSGIYMIEIKTSGNYTADTPIVVLVVIDADGKVVDAQTVSHAETPSPGGMQLEDGKFNANFIGKDEAGAGEVDTVSGATFTTTAYKNAILNAFNVVKILGGEDVDTRTEEEKFQDALEAALPGSEEFTKYFKVEIIEGIDSVYEAANGAGYVCVIGTDSTGTFIGVDANGVAVGEVSDEHKALAEAAVAKIAATELTDVDITEYKNSEDRNIKRAFRSIVSVQKTATGNYVFEATADGFGTSGEHGASGEKIYFKVSISSEGKIIDLCVTKHGETPSFGGDKLENGYYGEIFIDKDQAGSDEVDFDVIKNGATVTSNGLKKSILYCFIGFTIIKEASADEEKPYTRDGDYIYFGEYPQTIKADDVTITSTIDSRGYYLGSDGNYYAKVTATPYGSISYTFSTGTIVTSGNVYYFKVEPIRWRILSEKNGEALILCDSIIANHRFDDASNNYAESEIRVWLNASFYETAFSELAKSLILTTEIDNSAKSTNPHGNEMFWNSGVNKYACENTSDKIFLLSEEEATNGNFSFESYSTSDTARKLLTSDYSRANGAWMSTNSNYYGNGVWWLRSANYNVSYIARTNDAGGYANFHSNVYYSQEGVVPALRINLNAYAFVSTTMQ